MSAKDAAKIPKRIESIKFTLMDPNEIRKMSSVEVKTADTYKDDGHPFKQGLMEFQVLLFLIRKTIPANLQQKLKIFNSKNSLNLKNQKGGIAFLNLE